MNPNDPLYVIPVSGAVPPGGTASAFALGAGAAFVGQFGGTAVKASGTPTLSVAGTFSSGDYVGTSGTPITFSNVARVAGGTGVIAKTLLVDKAAQSVTTEVWLFDTAPTPPTDNAAWTITDAEAATCIGVIPISAWFAAGTANSLGLSTLPLPFKCAAASRDLYGCLVTRGAPVYADRDLIPSLLVAQD